MIVLRHFDSGRLVGPGKSPKYRSVQADLKIADGEDSSPQPIVVSGEVYYDGPPRDLLRTGTDYFLRLEKDNAVVAFDIVITAKTGEIVLSRNERRFFWEYLAVGRPTVDSACLFPDWYSERAMLVFVCTDFRGFTWPAEVAAVVLAPSQSVAKSMLLAELGSAGIAADEDNLTLKQLDITQSQALILNKGNY